MASSSLIDVPEVLKREIELHAEKLLKLTSSTSTIQWSTIWNKENITASKYYDSNLICVRGETILPYTIYEIFQLLSRGDCRRDLDTLIAQTQRLKWFSPHTGIERLVYKPVWPTDARDFSNITHWRLLEDGTLIMFAFSLPMDDICPEQPKYVRGNLLLGGYAMKHVMGGTQIYLVVQCDLSGRIPKPVAEFVAKTQPMALISLKNMLFHRYVNSMRPDLSTLPKPTYEELLDIARANQMTTQPIVKDLNIDENTLTENTCWNSNDVLTATELDKVDEESEITLRGFLYKERDTIKGWRSRYFTLDSDFLHYFLNKEDISPRNSLQLDASVVITIDSPNNIATDSAGNSLYAFVIRHPASSRSFRLASRTLAESTLWVKSIQAVIEKHKKLEVVDIIPNENDAVTDDFTNINNDPLYNLTTTQRNDIESTIEKLLNCTVNSQYEWNLLYKTNDVTATRTTDSDGNTIIRGESILPYTITEIFDVLSRAMNRKVLDPMIEIYQRKKWYNLHTGIEYAKYYPKWPASSRDFCNLTHWRLLPNNILMMVGLSVTDSSCPLKNNEDIVRGKLYCGGYVMQHVPESDGGGTKVYIIVKSNLGGSIPKSIVEFASRKQPMALASVREFLDKKYQNNTRVTRADSFETLFQELKIIAQENVGKGNFVKSGNLQNNNSNERGEENTALTSDANEEKMSEAHVAKNSSFSLIIPCLVFVFVIFLYFFLSLKDSPLLMKSLVLTLIFMIGIELYFGLIFQRLGSQKLFSSAHVGHYSMKLTLNLQDLPAESLGLNITSTDLVVQAIGKSLATSPSLHGYIFHGVFFPTNIQTPPAVSVQLFTQEVITLKNVHLLSLNDIHDSLFQSVDIDQDAKGTTSQSSPIISFLFHLFKVYFFRLYRKFSYGYAMVIPSPSSLSSSSSLSSPHSPHSLTHQQLHNLIITNDMSHSTFPVYVTLPHTSLQSQPAPAAVEGRVTEIPITITIHNAIPINQAVDFINLFYRNLHLDGVSCSVETKRGEN